MNSLPLNPFCFSLKVENKGQKYRDGWKTDSPTPPSPPKKEELELSGKPSTSMCNEAAQ